MKNSVTNFIEKNLTIILIIFIVWVIFSPLLFTQFSIVSFSNDGSTGQIGDTIGGITAPAIGILSAILLYLALTKQIENNNIIVHESNFKFIYNETINYRTTLKAYTLHGEYGIIAVKKFPEAIINSSGQPEDIYELLKEYDELIVDFKRLIYIDSSLETNKAYSDFLKKEIRNIYKNSFHDAFLDINIKWAVTDTDIIDLVKGKMLSIKNDLKIIHDVITTKYLD